MIVTIYGQSRGWDVRDRTVLVEGTTDVGLYQVAAYHEKKNTGIDLFADDLAIVAAGVGSKGGTRGVIRELIVARSIARSDLMPNGRPRHRFIGLVDNDNAGRQAIKGARNLDSSILEYRDIFRIWPVMPRSGNLDPKTMSKIIDRLNADYKGLDWELEDLLPANFVESFLKNDPMACQRETVVGDKTHRKFTQTGKAHLHRYIHKNAKHEDLRFVVDVIRWLRFCLNLPKV